MRGDKRTSLKPDSKGTIRGHKRGVVGYSRKTALLEEAITQMNAGKYGRSSTALKELLALDSQNMEARRLFATLHLRLGSLIPARQAFDSLINEAFQRQDYWLAESLLREYLAAGPRCVPFLEKLGLVYQEKGDVLEAVAEYGKAIDILIEDPDPDHPQLLSQLYQRIRDLAPASPVAFRLASFFDAQTGAFLRQEPNQLETAPESLVAPIDHQTIPEPVDGAMPWDIDPLKGVSDSSPESMPPPDGSIPVLLSEDNGIPSPEEISRGHGEQPVDISIQAQPASIIIETTPAHLPEQTHIDEGLGDTSAKEGDHPLIGVSPYETQSVILPSDSAAEVQVELLEPDATRVEDLPATAHGPVNTVQQDTHTGIGCTSESSDVQELESDHPAVPRELTTSTLEIEPTIVGRSQIESAPLPEAAQAAPDVAAPSHVESPGDIPVAEVSGQVAPQPVTEPWNEPGFSWASLFDRAWNFGSQNSADQETTQAKGEAPHLSEHPHQAFSPIESESVEIPEREENVALAGETPSTSTIQPMPWDSIQESVIPIPPAQVDEPHIEGTATTEEQSISTVGLAEVVQVDPDQFPTEKVAVSPSDERGPLAGTHLQPMPWDSIQESVIPIPPAQVDEPHIEGTATTEEQSISSVSSAEAVEVDQDQSIPLAAVAPASEEREYLTGKSSSAAPSPSDLDMNTVPVQHSEPQAPSPELHSEFSLAASRADEERLQLHEATGIEPAVFHTEQGDSVDVVVQVEQSSQSLSVPLEQGQDVEQESDAREPVGAQEIEAEPISESQSSHDLVQPSTNESNRAAVLMNDAKEAPLSLVEERIGDGEEETVVSQPVMMEERATPLPVSLTDIPKWQTPEPVAPSPIERETISALTRETSIASPSVDMAVAVPNQTDPRQEDMAEAESKPHGPEPVVQQEVWAKSESIRFVEEIPASLGASPAAAESEQSTSSPPMVTTADDRRFVSSRDMGKIAPREREVEFPSRPKIRSVRHGIHLAIQNFIGSCCSTTRAIVATGVGLILLITSVVALGIGAVGLMWVIMEEGPSPAYQSFTTTPQRTLSDIKKNGYFLLVGFDAPAQLDPIQAGYEGNSGTEHMAMERICLGDPQRQFGKQPNASANVSGGWFRSADPVGQFRSHSDTVQGWVSQQASALSRYGQWHTLPFEDWGYGQTAGLPCASIIFAHELYLADGFLQAMEVGVERLETDMEAWRIALSQAKTLSVKTLALQAMNDDIAVASGLLIRSDFDGKYLGRITKLLHPLDQAELSMRWPMQSELVSASKTYEAQVKAAKADDQSVYAVIASMLSLPKQRRLNDYAEYYEASYKAVGEGHHSALPKWKDYIRSPASTMTDYLANPIENLVGLEPLPPWDVYHGQVMDTEARLRLASLQAWLRRGPTDGDVPTRLAKAGQKFYDPYTGLPMLMNKEKGALYSVGHDGKDQDADPRFDVVVTIPMLQAQPSRPSSQSPAESSKP